MKNCIVMYSDENYAFAAANMCIGIQRYCSDWVDEIVIFNEGILEKTKNNMKKLYKNIVFIDYTKEYFFSKISIPMDNNFMNKWTHGVFSKLECFDMLHQYENIIYLDVDMLILKDFKNILLHKPLAWRPIVGYNAAQKIPELLREKKSTISAPNGGLVYFGKELLEYNTTSNDAYDILNKVLQFCTSSYDELVFSVICHQKNIPHDDLSIMYNCWHFHPDASHAYIIHPNGKDKFWNNKLISTAYQEWHINNKIWLAIQGECVREGGGTSPYSYGEIEKFINSTVNFEKVEKSLQHIETRLKQIEKAAFPVKRFIAHLRKLWNLAIMK